MFERSAITAMGARFEIVLEGRDSAHARAAAEAALELVAECDARWSLFRSDSLIARVNREARHGPVRLDEETYELLAACANLREQTAGAFDICVGASMHALGHRSTAERETHAAAGEVELDPTTRSVRLHGSDAALDLGGIAKGEALDRAAALLRDCGIERALMHGGTSSVLAIGAPPDSAGWRVALDATPDPRVVELCNRSLSVSAPHGRTLQRRHEEIGHIVDPHSGAALALGARVAALADTGRAAEAWSTAALVLLARGLDLSTCAPRSVQLLVCESAPSSNRPTPAPPSAPPTR